MSSSDRNAPCHCGSGKKYKKCCQHKVESGELYREEREHILSLLDKDSLAEINKDQEIGEYSARATRETIRLGSFVILSLLGMITFIQIIIILAKLKQ